MQHTLAAMRSLLSAVVVLLLVGCGTEPTAAPEPEPVVDVPPEPPPPLPELPPPLPECPEETWAVGSRGANAAASDGPAAANLVREAMRGAWERVSICRMVDGQELHMICAPEGAGAQCSLGMPGRRCSSTMPNPVLPVAAGDFVDNSALPGNSEWRCSNVR